MKRLFGILGIVFISPEILFILLLAIIYFAIPQSFNWLASKITSSDEQIKFLALAPLTLAGIIISKRNELLFPDHKNSQFLQEWPNYRMLLDRYWVCVIFSTTSAGISLGIWLIGLSLRNPTYLVVFIATLLTPIITFITFINATISVKRILALTLPKKANQ